jgi:hypothetical protein
MEVDLHPDGVKDVERVGPRGARDVKNYTGYVKNFKDFRLTPHPTKNGQIGPKKEIDASKKEISLHWN